MYLLQVLVETEKAFLNKSQNCCMLFQNFNTLIFFILFIFIILFIDIYYIIYIFQNFNTQIIR